MGMRFPTQTSTPTPISRWWANASRQGWRRRRARRSSSSASAAGPPRARARTPWRAVAAPPGRTGPRPGPATRPSPPASGQGLRCGPRPPSDLRLSSQHRAIVLVLFVASRRGSPGCSPAACGYPGVGGWCRQRPLRASDELVGEVGDTLAECLAVDEAHGFLVARLAEEALAGPEHDREDLQSQLVDEVVLDQRAQELEAAGDDDLPV